MPVRAGDTLDPARTRERVLQAAERVFYQRGIHAVGITDIAEAAGASKASIYKNFGSKSGLVEAALRYRSDRVRRWLEQGSADAETGRQRVLAVFEMLAAWYADAGFRGCALISAAAEDRADASAPSTRVARAHLDGYRALFTDALGALRVREPEVLARRLVILLEGATVVSAVDGDPSAGSDARAVAEHLLAAAARSD